MEFIDLKEQYRRIKPLVKRRLDTVLEHGRFIMGPEVRELEERLEALTGAKHCLTCGSGTMALELFLLSRGVGPGDAVFTTPFTFIATAECIARTGAVPVFIDIRFEDFNLNADALERAFEAVAKGKSDLHPLPKQAVEQRLRPKGIITVDLFGHPAAYDGIIPFAREHGLFVFEDAAQSFGGRYKDKALCACGCDAAAASFFPAKPLGCYGDGGALFTDDDASAALLDSLRYHGRIGPQDKYNNIRLGTNGRMDTMQAAVLLAKLEIFEEEVALRQKVAASYGALLSGIPGLVPHAPPKDGLSAWAQYTVLLPEGADRAVVAGRLKEAGIPTTINYPKPLHRQGAFSYLEYAEDAFPIALEASRRVLSLPMHPYLDEKAQEFIAGTLKAALA